MSFRILRATIELPFQATARSSRCTSASSTPCPEKYRERGAGDSEAARLRSCRRTISRSPSAKRRKDVRAAALVHRPAAVDRVSARTLVPSSSTTAAASVRSMSSRRRARKADRSPISLRFATPCSPHSLTCSRSTTKVPGSCSSTATTSRIFRSTCSSSSAMSGPRCAVRSTRNAFLKTMAAAP